MTSTLNEFRKYGIHSLDEFEQKLQNIAFNRQKILNKIKQKEKDMALIYSTIENLNTLSKNRLIYDLYKKIQKISHIMRNTKQKSYLMKHLKSLLIILYTKILT